VRLYTFENKALVENLPRNPTPVNMKQGGLEALVCDILRLLSQHLVAITARGIAGPLAM
jgi:hypothetical protein